jgi:hypothetical protein
MPAKANPLTLAKYKDTQNKNQLREDNSVGNNIDTIIDTNIDKCNMCS